MTSFYARPQDFIPVVCAGSEVMYYAPGWEGSTFLWEVEGVSSNNYEIIGNGNDTITIRWGFQPETFTLKVTETSEYGCEGNTIEVTGVINTPFVHLGSDLIYCVGEPLELDPEYNAEAVDLIEWYSRSTGSDVILSNQPLFTLNEARQDSFMLKVYENVNYTELYSGNAGVLVCTNSDTIRTYVRDYPNVNLQPRDTVLCGSQELEINALRGVDESVFDNLFINWYHDDINSDIQEMGQYHTVGPGEKDVIAEVTQIWNIEDAISKACTTYDTLQIERCSAEELFVARAFMPEAAKNEDNRIWTIRNAIGADLNMIIEVYNRWGARVWYHEGPYSDDKRWDGTSLSGKKLPMDSYYYIISIEIVPNEWIKKQGTVTIVR